MKRSNNQILKIVFIIIGGMFLFSFVMCLGIGGFLVSDLEVETENNKTLSENKANLAEDKAKTNEVTKVEKTEKTTKKPVPTATIKPTAKETKQIATNTISLQEYNDWVTPKVSKLTNLFNQMTLHSSQNDFINIINDFDQIYKIEKEFKKKTPPIELNKFKKLMLNMFSSWHDVEEALLIDDALGVTINGQIANDYLGQATIEYKSVMGIN